MHLTVVVSNFKDNEINNLVGELQDFCKSYNHKISLIKSHNQTIMNEYDEICFYKKSDEIEIITLDAIPITPDNVQIWL